MAQDDIQGQVVDGSGNPVEDAIVELTRSYQSSPTGAEAVRRTTTDSNGNYIFTGHPDGDGTTQEWHVAAYSHDGTAYVNSFNNPGVTADLPEIVIPDSGVAYYLFDESSGPTANDSWNSYDATTSGVTFGATGPGSKTVYGFDGTDAYVYTGRQLNGEYGLGSVSTFGIGVWFYSNSTANVQHLISQYDRDAVLGLTFAFDGSSDTLTVSHRNVGGNLDNAANYARWTGVARDQWHYLTINLSNDDGSVDGWLDNGLTPDSQNASNYSSINYGDTDLKFGAQSTPVERYFSGRMGQVRLHSSEVTESDHTDRYNNPE